MLRTAHQADVCVTMGTSGESEHYLDVEVHHPVLHEILLYSNACPRQCDALGLKTLVKEKVG